MPVLAPVIGLIRPWRVFPLRALDMLRGTRVAWVDTSAMHETMEIQRRRTLLAAFCMPAARLRHSFFGEEELMTMVIAGWMANELAPFLNRRACGDTECAHPSCAEVRMLAAATGANRIETALLPLLEERIWLSRCNRRRVSTSIPVRSKMCYSSIPRWSMPV
jgi:hypothetical protein